MSLLCERAPREPAVPPPARRRRPPGLYKEWVLLLSSAAESHKRLQVEVVLALAVPSGNPGKAAWL